MAGRKDIHDPAWFRGSRVPGSTSTAQPAEDSDDDDDDVPIAVLVRQFLFRLDNLESLDDGIETEATDESEAGGRFGCQLQTIRGDAGRRR